MSPPLHATLLTEVRRCFLLLGTLCGLVLFLIAVDLPAAPAEAPPPKPRTITQVTQIRALAREEAGTGVLVRLKGTVTWQSAKDDSFVLSDGGSGILVRRIGLQGNSVWAGGEFVKADCEPGSLVEVDGVTDAGGYAPHVLVRHLRKTGTTTLKKGTPIDMMSAFSTLADGARIRVSGVVQGVVPPTATASGSLLLFKQDRFIPVQIEHWEGINAEELVDATVKVEGIFAPSSNLRAELLDLRIKMMSREDIEIITPPPGDPFLSPGVPLDRLQRYSQKGNDPHRKVTQGIVTFTHPGQFFFIQDGELGVRVRATGPVALTVGERVQVAGFVDMSRLVASMSGAVVRRLGPVALPLPLPVTVEQILHPKEARPREVANDCDGRLVRLRGRVQRIETGGENAPWQFAITTPRGDFSATLLGLEGEDLEATRAWIKGTDVELTGVCELTFVRRPDLDTPAVADFRLWLRSPQDVRILQSPSWWTSPRLTIALVATLVVLLLAVAWIAALRRAVRVRTQRLEEVMRLHRDSELEFQAALQERQRLAADLHDGLQQMIAGATFRLEAAVDQLPEISLEAQEELTAARRALLHTQTGLRDYLWGLRNVEEGPGDFAALLRHAVSSNEQWPGGSVIVHSSGEPFDLSRDVMGNLLLLMQEAVSNALRHGHAGQVVVGLEYEITGLDMRIEDDGIGFIVENALGTREGHFGLQGMRERMRRLGGTVEIVSTPGHGTRVRVHLSRAAARAHEAGPTASSPAPDGQPIAER